MKIDLDIQMLEKANNAILNTQPRMRKATIKFLWDKFITHPSKELKRRDSNVEKLNSKKAQA